MKNIKKFIIPVALLSSLVSCSQSASNDCADICEDCTKESSTNKEGSTEEESATVEGLKARKLEDYIDVTKLKLGVLFDIFSVQDINGAVTSVSSSNLPIYRQGYKSIGYSFYSDSTVITCNDLTLGSNSFTFATWFNPHDLKANNEQNVLFSNKLYSDSTGNGVNFYINASSENLVLSASITAGGEEINVAINPDSTFFGDNWMHFMVVYNKSEKVCDAYFNFKKLNSFAIPEAHFAEGTTLDSNNSYMLGIDGAKTSQTRYNGVLDDILVFDHAVNSNTIDKLKQYYLD